MSNTVYSLLAQHREEAQLGEAVEQLKVLPAFHKVFDVHLFTDEVSSLVYQLAELDKTSAEYSAVIDKLNAISYLKKFLHDLAVKGSEANQHIIEAQSYLHEEDEE
jgi:hypothetical protein